MALQELRRERERFEWLVDRVEAALGPGMASSGGFDHRAAMRRRSDGTVARTAIWATAAVASVSIALYGAVRLADAGVFDRPAHMAGAYTVPGAPPTAAVPPVMAPVGAAPLPSSSSQALPIAPGAAARTATSQTTARRSAEEMLTLGSFLTGVRPAAIAGEAPRGIVYFDPRCPYCHAAWTALADQNLDLLWLPVPALGSEDSGTSKIAAVLYRAGEGKTVLAEVFGSTPPTAVMTPELQGRADENTAGFMALARAWPQEIEGVPAFVIRGKDGQAKVGSGWPPPTGLLE
ncbi:hypothetical protein [Inquilinus sp.]|uniref:hypothetical protein n=1 Tax=Inquilinus sp. TaxID=1932117 RepID=UPI003784BD8A